MDKIRNNIKVCFISHSSGIAGAEKAFPKLLKGLQGKGLEIYVFLPEKGPIEQVLDRKEIEYYVIKYGRWINSDKIFIKRIKRTIKNLLITFPLALKIKKLKCDVVYTNTSTIISGALAARLLGLPHIWHFREFGIEDYGFSYDLGQNISEFLLNHLSDLCPVNSIAVKNKYSKFIPESKLKVLYESYKKDEDEIQEEITFQPDKNSFNCIMIGTLHETKGHIDAINAIAILRTRGIPVKLIIVGTGNSEYKRKLDNLILSLNIKEEIIFLGYKNNPITILKKCDTLLMCSKSEAFGLVTLEAMENGIPVIGTNTGGTTELILDSYNGLLYSHGNYSELAEKIYFYYINPSERKRYTENAIKHINSLLSPESYINNTISIIKKLTFNN